LLCSSRLYLPPTPANKQNNVSCPYIYLLCSSQLYLRTTPANKQNNVSYPYTCSTQAGFTYVLHQQTNKTTSAIHILALLKPALLTSYTSKQTKQRQLSIHILALLKPALLTSYTSKQTKQRQLSKYLLCSSRLYLPPTPANKQNNVSCPYTCSAQAGFTYHLYQQTNKSTSAIHILALLKLGLLTSYTNKQNILIFSTFTLQNNYYLHAEQNQNYISYKLSSKCL